MDVVCILKTNAGYFLMTNEEHKCIQGFKSEEEGLRSFEAKYHDALSRGGSWPASACIHMIEFQPAIVKFNDIEEIKKCIPKKWSVFSLSAVSGYYSGIKLKKKEGKAAWKRGKEPRLMKI